jgi:hypothetical protein
MFNPTRVLYDGPKTCQEKNEENMNKLQKVYVDKWVKALRSDEYKQTQGKLKGEGGFCCLGVLCDVATPVLKEQGIDAKWTKNEEDGEGDFFEVPIIGDVPEKAQLALPGVLVDLFGFQGSCGNVRSISRGLPKKARAILTKAGCGISEGETSLANLNDKGVPFKVIADIIEACPNTFMKTPKD